MVSSNLRKQLPGNNMEDTKAKGIEDIMPWIRGYASIMASKYKKDADDMESALSEIVVDLVIAYDGKTGELMGYVKRYACLRLRSYMVKRSNESKMFVSPGDDHGSFAKQKSQSMENLRSVLSLAKRCLTPVENKIIRYKMAGFTADEMSSRLGVSRDKARVMSVKAVHKLKMECIKS